MTTIASVQPPGSAAVNDPAVGDVEEAQPSSPGRYTPLWLVGSGSQRHTLDVLGIRMPKANGDISAMLAEVSLNFEQSVDESRNKRTISDFASLASALSSSNLTRARREVGLVQLMVDNATATLQAIVANMTPLEQRRDDAIADIASYRSDIARLQAALADPGLSSTERAALESQLAAASQGLSDVMVARESIDIGLANVWIDGLDRIVADLEGQLAVAEPGTIIANDIADLLTAVRAQLGNARQELATFQAGPKTDPAREQFSIRVITALHQCVQNLQARLANYQDALAAALVDMDNVNYLALSAAANATSAFKARQLNQLNDDALGDSGTERVFEAIADKLKAFAASSSRALDTIEKSEDARLDRIRAVAIGITDSLSDLATTLSQLEAVEPPASFSQHTVANRLRLTI